MKMRELITIVEGNKAKKVTVVRAFTMKKDREVPDGWDVLVDDEWHERYSTRKQANIAADALRKTPDLD